ncbi:MAG TPA: response regulator [Candidatus Saccharimonadia bacterium]|nr:response regulator [Candidatus Saccharimonadia bacterium]
MLPKVLLIEDDDVIREIYAMKFELDGFPVASASNGRIGLQMVEDFEPQVILLDMMMPVMGGLEFMQALKKQGRALPDVIVFSNISAPKQVDAVMRLGAKAYWTKSDYTPDRVSNELVKLWNDK